MSLLLTIVAAPASVSVAESSKTFDVEGGTIGRGKENTWVLDDPERFLSSLHCRISSENGNYFLSDLSTNGTFLNGASHPMGKGRKVPLHDGDTFSLGDYKFSASLWNPAQTPFASPNFESAPGGDGIEDLTAAQEDPFASPWNEGGIVDSGSTSPFDRGMVSAEGSLFEVLPEETDPFAALEKAQGGPSFGEAEPSDPFGGPSYSDQAEAPHQQISWPSTIPETFSGVMIPDDWDEELPTSEDPYDPSMGMGEPGFSHLSAPPPPPTPGRRPRESRPRVAEVPAERSDGAREAAEKGQASSETAFGQQTTIERANAKIAAELAILKKQMLEQSRNVASAVTVDTSLVDAIGFQGLSLTNEKITEINLKAGDIIREAVRGLMQVLGSRSSIKNEFRMNMTTIQSVENNPLKFSANVDDALENMFVKQGNAYMKPVEAVREGFDSIAEHQIAVIAGIRAAFKSVIERFDPSRLEARFQKQQKVGFIPGIQKAKNWELYNEYYSELVGDLDSSFQYLFGDEFVQAYEDQLRKLTAAKEAKSKSGNK